LAYSQVISEWSMQSDKPTLLLLEVVFCLFKLLIKLPNFTPKSADLGNQLNVVFHDVQMLFLVNLSFFLKTLLQGSHRVVQVLLLVLILLLDVCVDFHVFHRLVLNILEETILGCKLQLFVIVNVVHNEVNCVFESLNVGLIFSDFISALLDDNLHLLLSSTKIINDKTKTSISGVVFL